MKREDSNVGAVSHAVFFLRFQKKKKDICYELEKNGIFLHFFSVSGSCFFSSFFLSTSHCKIIYKTTTKQSSKETKEKNVGSLRS